MKLAPGLQSLFLMLRNAGISVGIEEIARLDTIFGMEPALDRDGLRRVLESTLVKQIEERESFHRIYDAWLKTTGIQLEREDAARERRLEVDRVRAKKRGKAARKGSSSGAAAEDARPAMSVNLEPAIPFSAGKSLDLVVPHPGQMSAPGLDTLAMGAPEHDDDLFGPPPVEPPPAGSPSGESKASPTGTAPIAQPTGQSPTKPTMPARNHGSSHRMIWPVVLLGALIIGVGVWIFSAQWSATTNSEHADADITEPAARDAGPGDAQAMMAERDFTSHKPVFVVYTQPPPERSYLGYLLVLGALLLIFWLWSRFGRGAWIPDISESAGSLDTAPRGSPRRSLETLMLDERDEEELVWGVGRFISEDDSRHLDIDRTVRETASAFGRPVLCYQGTQYQREVWLWIDESMDTPVARHLADDLELMLQKSGLPVTRATFWGIPERLRTDSNEIITIDAFDSRRDSAAVAVLTDGRMMSQADRARNRRGDLHNLLRNLSFWPRITFIDFGADRLAPLCASHHLRWIKPHDAASAISDLTEEPERSSHQAALVGDARVWAAACMLTPFPISERRALSLRRELAVNASPWLIHQISERADERAGGFQFSVAERASLLGWLVQAEALPDGGELPSGTSLLSRTVASWERVLNRHAAEQARFMQKQGLPWRDTGPNQDIELERECVRLWTNPDSAAMALYRRHEADSGRQRQVIREYLSHLGPRERLDRDDIIALPWSLDHVQRRTRVVLGAMNFGGASSSWSSASMPVPGRVWLALGLCVGLLIGAASALIEQTREVEKPAPTLEVMTGPDNAYSGAVEHDEQKWTAIAGIPGELDRATMRRGDNVRVEWERRAQPCRTVRDGYELRRCASNGDPAANPDRRYWSFAILVKRYPRQADDVADELLVSKSVDGVFLVDSEDAIADIPMDELSRPGEQGRRDQLIIIADKIPSNIGEYKGRHVIIGVDQTASLIGVTDDLEASRPLDTQLPDLRPLADGGDTGNFHVYGTGLCGELEQPCCVAPGERCGEGLRCEPEQDQCVVEDCSGSEENTCSEDNRVAKECVDNVWVETTCEPMETCSDGACLPTRCSNDEWRCTPRRTRYKQCEGRTSWSAPRDCDDGTVCTRDKPEPCKQIRRAKISLLAVAHQHKQSKNAVRVWDYDLSCHANDPEQRHDVTISTAPIRSSLDRTFDVPYTPDQPIELTCRYKGVRSDAVRMVERKPVEKRKTHGWSGAAERSRKKPHRLVLKGFEDIDRVVIHYTIELIPSR